MGIAEQDALPGQLVDPGRLRLRMASQAAQIVIEVIDDYQNHVWLPRRLCGCPDWAVQENAGQQNEQE